MKIHAIHDLSDRKVIDTLKFAMFDVIQTDLIMNYHPDYHDQPGNLFYILDEGRYRPGHGKYYVITDDYDKYVCSAGWNEYEQDTDTALVLTRMYVSPGYRCQYILGNTVLPDMIEAARDYKRIWITSNNHNRAIYTYFERADAGQRTALFKDWPPIYKRFKPIGKSTVYYTEQWIAEYEHTREDSISTGGNS